MSGRWVEVTDESESAPFWKRPGVWFIAALVLLLGIIAGAVVLSQLGAGDDVGNITIENLKADNDQYDGREVILTGNAEDIRRLPILDQYAIYNFRDETGTIRVLSDKGAPPDGELVELTGTFNSAVTLDEQLKRIIDDQFGGLVGSIADIIIPEIPLNVVYVRHESYAPVDSP